MSTSHLDFSGKRVVVLGYGLEGRASIDFLTKQFPEAKIVVADSSPSIDVSASANVVDVFVGDAWLDALHEADIIIRSPGVPYSYIYKSPHYSPEKTKVTSITDIFLSRHKDKTIGITGTKGKSTTSTLMFEVLRSLGFNVQLIGNIGKPAISQFDGDADFYVYELSSYQLQDVSYSPRYSVFLNIFPEHLDHHGDFESYVKAKGRICSHQGSKDICIFSSLIDLKYIEGNGEKIAYDNSYFEIREFSLYYKKDSSQGALEIFDLKKSNLRGIGNLRNIQALYTLVHALGLEIGSVADVVYGFKPLEHRMEIVKEHGDLIFINDSISTVPQAALNAMDAYRDEVRSIILGGYDRGIDYSLLAQEVLAQKIPLVLLFKPSGERINDEIQKQTKTGNAFVPEVLFVNNMEEAVKLTLEKVSVPGVCLMSPASPSFGLFKNFEERGRSFKQAVSSLG